MCLFLFRNYIFIVLHLILQGMVYTEYTWEVFGYCRDLDFPLCYLLLPYLLLIVNLACFTLSSVTDPGMLRLHVEPAQLSVLLIVLQTPRDAAKDFAKDLLFSVCIIFPFSVDSNFIFPSFFDPWVI